jgi:hypothetical protein
MRAFFLEMILISAYFIMEERYIAEYLPYLVFAYALFLREASVRGPFRGRAQDLVTVLIFAVGISSMVSIFSTLSVIPISGPSLSAEYKDGWSQRFRAIDAQFARLRGQ